MTEALEALREVLRSRRNVIITVAGARTKCPRGWSGSPNPIAPSDICKARDQRWIVVAAISHSTSLMAMMGRQDRADDLALASNEGRVAHDPTVDALISGWTAERDAADRLAELEPAEVPSSPIHSAAHIERDVHFSAREMVLKAQVPDGTTIAMPGITTKLSAIPGRFAGWARLGAHEVLAEFDYNAADIVNLSDKGVV